jgi:hypothetical protein
MLKSTLHLRATPASTVSQLVPESDKSIDLCGSECRTRNCLYSESSSRLDTGEEGGDVEEEEVLGSLRRVAREDGGPDSGAVGDGLVRVDRLQVVGLLPVEEIPPGARIILITAPSSPRWLPRSASASPRLARVSHVALFFVVVVANDGDAFSPFLPLSLLKPSYMYIHSGRPNSGLLQQLYNQNC